MNNKMKTLLIFYSCFVSCLCLAQQNEDSIQTKILTNSGNLYIKSKYFEGVIFVHDQNDSLFWTPNINEILLIESYLKEYLNEKKVKLPYFFNMNYQDLSSYCRQYITRYYTNSKKNIFGSLFFKKR